jgi:hypothetical protein
LNSARTPLAVAVAVLVAALALSACGSKKKTESSGSGPTGATGANLDVSITEAGKAAKYTVAKSVKGGLATLTVSNKGKGPHSAQLARIEGDHTAQDALKIIGAQSDKTPDWLRAEGGVGAVGPGQTANASVILDPGKYIVVDEGGPESKGPPGYSEFTVEGKTPGSLPGTPTTITAANPGKEKYRWDIKGELKSGTQQVTFVSKGKEALHIIAAARLNSDASKDQIVKALESEAAKPPKFIDQTSFYGTAVIDGGKTQVAPLSLRNPGRWVLFCPLPDREGGKPHFKEGLIKVVTVK